MKKILFSIAVLFLLRVPLVHAHDAWLERSGEKFVVVYGHLENREEYQVSKVKEVKAFDMVGKGKSLVVKEEDGKAFLSPPKDTMMITMVFDNGFWVKRSDGWKNISKREAKDYLESSHSIKFSKHLIGWSPAFMKPVGLRMEIVPLKDPFALKTGDALPIKVLFEGKPLTGAVISTNGMHNVEMKTNHKGVVEVPITQAGFQLISASYKIPMKDNLDADVLSLSANLTFSVK